MIMERIKALLLAGIIFLILIAFHSCDYWEMTNGGN
tara:strand:+ start:2729 stop:2836 length:108 start_codon:yes stop_codon:yes gene_type:complete